MPPSVACGFRSSSKWVCWRFSGDTHTAFHLAVVLLRESYLGDRHLYHTLWVRAGLISKRTEEGAPLCHQHTVLKDMSCHRL